MYYTVIYYLLSDCLHLTRLSFSLPKVVTDVVILDRLGDLASQKFLKYHYVVIIFSTYARLVPLPSPIHKNGWWQ